MAKLGFGVRSKFFSLFFREDRLKSKQNFNGVVPLCKNGGNIEMYPYSVILAILNFTNLDHR